MPTQLKGSVMAEVLPGGSEDAEALLSALNLMKEALQFLDESRPPADIGAHLDHAIARLAQHLAGLTS